MLDRLLFGLKRQSFVWWALLIYYFGVLMLTAIWVGPGNFVDALVASNFIWPADLMDAIGLLINWAILIGVPAVLIRIWRRPEEDA